MVLNHDQKSGFATLRLYGSRSLFAFALVLLIISIFLLVKMWVYAYIHDLIPETSWGNVKGNHGPWRHTHNLREVFWLILNMQVYSFGAAIISLVIKPNKKSAVIAGIAFIVFFLFMYTHYWLVD